MQSKGQIPRYFAVRSAYIKPPFLCVHWPVPLQCNCTGLSFIISSIINCSSFITIFPVLVLRCATSEHSPVQGPQVTVHQSNQPINQPSFFTINLHHISLSFFTTYHYHPIIIHQSSSINHHPIPEPKPNRSDQFFLRHQGFSKPKELCLIQRLCEEISNLMFRRAILKLHFFVDNLLLQKP